jgi:hypothetical protein
MSVINAAGRAVHRLVQAVYYFAPDWKEEHVHRHLKQTSGILQADGYKGYGKLYLPGADGTSRFQKAACRAHRRRDFHDIWTSNKSEIAREALDRIGAPYEHRARHHRPGRRDPSCRTSELKQTKGRSLPPLGRSPTGNPPVFNGLVSRIHAAIFSFCAGVMPPMPILGRSLLYVHSHCVANSCASSMLSMMYWSSHSCRTVRL